MSDFHRFPHTPHLAWLGKGEPRDDKVLSKEKAYTLLSAPVRVEEKIDGANLGLSVGPDGRLHAQNRGQYLESPIGVSSPASRYGWPPARSRWHQPWGKI